MSAHHAQGAAMPQSRRLAPLFATLALLSLILFALISPLPTHAALQIGQVLKLADKPIAKATLSPNGVSVVFISQNDVLDSTLKSIPFKGGQAVSLTPQPITASGSLSYSITGDSSRVVILSQLTGSDTPDLYSIPIRGGQITHLAANLPAGTTVDFFRLTPDGKAVVFQATRTVSLLYHPTEIYVVPVDGSSVPRRLNAAFGTNDTVRQWVLSKDGSRVVYLVGQEGSGVAVQLVGVALAGSIPAMIDTFTIPSGVSQILFTLSDDGSRIVYRRPVSETEEQLFTASTTSGGPAQVSAPATAKIFSVAGITPDNGKVVYTAGPVTGTEGVYSAPLTGGGSFTSFMGNLPADSSFGATMSPDGAHVLITATSNTTLRTSLVSTSINGSAPFLIEPQLPSGGGISLSRITPDSARIVYREGSQYFSTPITGGSPVLIADNMDSAATNQSFLLNFTADSKYMIFRGRVVGEQGYPLFITPVAEAGGLQRLSGQIATVAGPPVVGSGVLGFALDSSGGRIVFLGTTNPVGGAMSVYAVETGTQPAGLYEKYLYLPLLS